MLLIDDVRYEEWTPASEDEFEQAVKEHAKDNDNWPGKKAKLIACLSSLNGR